jgi:hypothetical protein
MKRRSGKKKNSAPPEMPLAELVPRPNPPAERNTHKIILNVFGKRYELTRHTEVRLLTKGPAKVIEMPAGAGKPVIREEP